MGSEIMNNTEAFTESSDVLPVPSNTFNMLEEDSQAAGGAFEEPEEYKGSVGKTMFDLPGSKDGTITVLMPATNIDGLPNQALVRIKSIKDSRTYLGAVVEGPFAEPDGLRADSTPLVVTTVNGGILTPRYHGRVQVEIIGEELPGGIIVPPRYRPKPNSPAFPLNAEETAKVLKTFGDIRIGLADGFDDLVVAAPNSKSVWPRHVGVLGTTGGGKSTTVSGLINKAQKAGFAVIVIDTEGEYCAINEPTEDQRMLTELERRGLASEGAANSHVLHLVGRGVANSKHPSITKFSLNFSALSIYMISEILELSEAQNERLFRAYDVCKVAMEKFKIWPVTQQERADALLVDELQEGFPHMKLSHLYDVIHLISCMQTSDPDPHLATSEFQQNIDSLKNAVIAPMQVPGNKISWRAVLGKLGRLKRLGVFDSGGANHLDFNNMIQSGRISLIDLSDTDEPKVNNLCIAELLRGIQEQQEICYQQALKKGVPPTPVLIFVEEAHEFLSAQRIKQMPVLFSQVARIARRGRKRWLGMVFITQLPQHLPDEVLGLINNWILHKIGDAAVMGQLKRSIGGLAETQWRNLLSLAPGQAICSFSSLARPLQVSIDPTPCKLLMVD